MNIRDMDEAYQDVINADTKDTDSETTDSEETSEDAEVTATPAQAE